MKKTKLYYSPILAILVLTSSLFLVQCESEQLSPIIDAVTDLFALENVTQSTTGFGLDLLRNLNESSDPAQNIFISPLSISAALAMTNNGAAGQTQTDIHNTISSPDITTADLNASYKRTFDIIEADSPRTGTQLNIANSIWYRDGFAVKQDFLDMVTDNFSSEVRAVNFGDPATLDLINGWIEDKTNDKIKDMLDNIPGGAVMYLINAIYFKGDWKYEFDPENTVTSKFQLQDGSETDCEMMQILNAAFPYYSNELFHAISLAYGDSTYSMTIIQPHEGVDIKDFTSEFTQESWETLTDGSLEYQPVMLQMPKFKVDYKTLLNEPLTDLGMGIAFGPNADLSNIADADLAISRVIHQSFVEVNEQGTEAAAATIVEIIETTTLPPTPVVNLDRPFLFVIHKNETNTILFAGKLMNPNG